MEATQTQFDCSAIDRAAMDKMKIESMRREIATCRTSIAILRTLLREARDDAKQSMSLVVSLADRVQSLEKWRIEESSAP